MGLYFYGSNNKYGLGNRIDIKEQSKTGSNVRVQMQKIHLIVGMGEVGTAIDMVLSRNRKNRIYCIDYEKGIYQKPENEKDKCDDFLHICFPYSDKFVSHVKQYIDEFINQAEIKKGTKIYDHGVSLGQAANILGISQWELMNYVGKTRFGEPIYDRPDTIDKIKFTRGLFE